MAAIEITYGPQHSDTLSSFTVAADSLALALDHFHLWARDCALDVMAKRATVNGLIIWSHAYGDHDRASPMLARSMSPLSRQLPIFPSDQVIDLFLGRSDSLATWTNGGVFLTTADAQHAWTTPRIMLHLAECGVASVLERRQMRPLPTSAHQRLALLAAVETLRQRDGARRGSV
jgi:hypothetical protein